MAKVIIDAGHGGNDPGDIYQNRLEKDDNLRLALAVGDRLQNEYGVDTIYTRTSDLYLSQMNRAKIANNEGGDLLVSIHRIIGDLPESNAGLSFYIDSEGGLAEAAANKIGQELEKVAFPNYSIILRTDLPLFRDTTTPSLAIGIGNLNSDYDNELFDTRFDEIADAIARGIVNTVAANHNHLENQDISHSAASIGNRRETYYVQLGAFLVYQNAEKLQEELLLKGLPAIIARKMQYYVVLIGGFCELDEAVEWEIWLRRNGYNTFLITAYSSALHDVEKTREEMLP